jgi:predicted phage terminase large subunit-like protein
MVTTAYPIWAILGKQQKKFVLILSQTQVQARQILTNIKDELTNNSLLKSDLGPFEEPDDEWRSSSIVIPKYGARIMVASREGREKTFRWLASEVLPAGDTHTKVIIIGNLVHEDSVIMRLREKIKNDEINGSFYRYPIMDENGVSLWPGKFPDAASLKEEEKRVLNPQAWFREYLLKIIPEEGQIVYPEWIHYWDELPSKNHQAYRCTYSAVDLAISKKDSADYTAVVSALVFGRRDKLKIYILPNPINKKLSFPEQIELLKNHVQTSLSGYEDKLFVESVAYQDALPQMLETYGIEAIGIKPRNDKGTRLSMTTPLMQSAKILFPRKGAEHLIQQLLGFGIESHDDLADAFSLLINQITETHFDENTCLMAVFSNNSSDGISVLYHPDYVDID